MGELGPRVGEREHRAGPSRTPRRPRGRRVDLLVEELVRRDRLRGASWSVTASRDAQPAGTSPARSRQVRARWVVTRLPRAAFVVSGVGEGASRVDPAVGAARARARASGRHGQVHPAGPSRPTKGTSMPPQRSSGQVTGDCTWWCVHEDRRDSGIGNGTERPG